MYAVYCYKAGTTPAQIISDICALLSGTTAVASLSAACVQASSSIVATVPAGWSVYDAAAGANSEVVRALAADGVQYKYLQLTGANTTITHACAEAWNNVSHSGTNSGAPVTPTMTVDLVNGGFLYIYADQKNVVIMPWTTGGGYQNGMSFLEFSRDTPSTPTGYPCHVLCRSDNVNAGGNNHVSRFKNGTAAGDLVNSNSACVCPVSVGSVNSLGAPLYRDTSEVTYYAPYNLGVGLAHSAGGYAWAGSVSNVKAALTTSAAANLDELAVGGTTYVAFAGNNQTCTIFVPKQ